MLDEHLSAKVADFGLSRRCYENFSKLDLFKDDDDPLPLRLPVKWLAPEVLQHHSIIPEKSDVWSYGVMAWEVFQLGADPYRKGKNYFLRKRLRVSNYESQMKILKTMPFI